MVHEERLISEDGMILMQSPLLRKIQQRHARRKLIKVIVFGVVVLLLPLLLLRVYQGINNEIILPIKCKSEDFSVPEGQEKRRTDAVILLSTMRSGASIVGSIFNEREDTTYFYEPLLPFGERPCASMLSERIQVLLHISRCELEKIPPLYGRGIPPDKFSRCKKNSLCFMEGKEKYLTFLSRDMAMCKNVKGAQHCPKHMDFLALNKFCRQSSVRAMKVIRFCKLEWLLPLLNDLDYNVKVVHVVRDPRGTVNSIVQPWTTTLKVKRHASMLCKELTPNLIFANEQLFTSKYHDKYLRIRYEDFALDPVGKAQQIFDFVGINMLETIKKWLLDATSSKNPEIWEKTHPGGLRRNARKAVSSWRKDLKWEQVTAIQDRCREAIKLLGYRMYLSSEEVFRIGALHYDTDLAINKLSKILINENERDVKPQIENETLT